MMDMDHRHGYIIGEDHDGHGPWTWTWTKLVMIMINPLLMI